MLVSNWDTSTLTLKNYSPSAGASSSSLTRVSISPDFSPVLVLMKKYFMKTFGAAALGAPCLLSKSSLMSYCRFPLFVAFSIRGRRQIPKRTS